MSVTLIHRINEMNLEYTTAPKFLTIKYNGSFTGKILGNTKSSISRDKINIEFLNDIPEVLMIYAGNIEILGILAKNSDLEQIKGASFKIVDDQVQRIKAQFDKSDQKWEDYNKSNRYYRPMLSVIEYKENDDIKYQEARGKVLSSLPHRNKLILNKIRGDYGVK